MKIAIVYHYIAHYRYAIFKEVMADPTLQFTVISQQTSGNNIRTIDPALSKTSIEKGGLRWLFVKNVWFLKERLLWQSGLLRHLQRQKFDVVIFLGNVYYISTWLSILLLKLQRKKIYLWTHGVTSDKIDMKWHIRSFFYKLADGLFLYGHNAKMVMEKNGFPGHKLHVIYNSLDYGQQLFYRDAITEQTSLEAKNTLFKKPELPLIVFVGRLTAQKKLNMIVEASKQLWSKGFKINTLFIGNGDAKDSLESLVRTYGIQDFFNFYGACYEEEILSRLIGSADLCVSPGEVGLTAITALGYGTPVLTHNDFNHQMPEYEAIIPGTNGDFFERDSIEDLASKIEQWILTRKDRPRELIRKDCHAVVDSKYNPHHQAKIIHEIILGQ